MCVFAVIDVKFKNSSDRDLRRIDTRERLAKELLQLEKLGTVESVTVFHNHHTHRLTEAWADEMYREPVPDVLPMAAALPPVALEGETA